ncbi:MAG: TIGR02996 domain-containing protein [Planctomycetes bacterium]|nr:TIGR02996 domain-containing protein [Planctomycetota bacterium]
MTTEDDFNLALDENPDDWHTRLVFADWLDDRADPRASGYRALGTIRRRSFMCGYDNGSAGQWNGAGWVACGETGDREKFTLPRDWFDLVEGFGSDATYRPLYQGQIERKVTRRAVEDAMARAFLKLPEARRGELLATPPPKKRARRKRAK